MYDTLAMSMKIAGRPQKDIERVLLSRIDFTTTDIPGLLYSAAFLARLEAPGQALRMYRQAATLAPDRPEPYVLGLKIARQMKDYEATAWACSGILENVWTDDRKQRHLDAEDALTDALKELETGNQKAEADKLKKTVAESRRRDLIMRLEWSGNGDLDLAVEEPIHSETQASVCSVLNQRSPGGGRFTHDGYGPAPENCYDEYVCVRGMSGDYRARISHSSGDIVGKRCQLIVTRYQGTREELVRKVDVPLDKPEKVVRISLNDGRRQEPLVIPEEDLAPSSLDRRSRSERVVRLSERGSGVIGVGPRVPAGDGRIQQAGGIPQGFRLPAGSFTAGIGYQPVIGFVSSGVSLTATAVVSADRRYVRMALAPVFSALTEIQTFSFQGGQQQGGQQQGGGGQPAQGNGQ